MIKLFLPCVILNIDHTNKILHFQKPSICTQSLGTFCFLNFTKLICTSFNLVQIGRCSNWNISIYLLFTQMLIISECCRMERTHYAEIIEISKLLKWIIETFIIQSCEKWIKKSVLRQYPYLASFNYKVWRYQNSAH